MRNLYICVLVLLTCFFAFAKELGSIDLGREVEAARHQGDHKKLASLSSLVISDPNLTSDDHMESALKIARGLREANNIEEYERLSQLSSVLLSRKPAISIEFQRDLLNILTIDPNFKATNQDYLDAIIDTNSTLLLGILNNAYVETSNALSADTVVPRLNIAPPAVGYTNTTIASGVSPESIKDPDLRRKYEARIAANQRAITAHNYAITISRIKKEITTDCIEYFKRQYGKSPEQRKKFNILLEKHLKPGELFDRLSEIAK